MQPPLTTVRTDVAGWGERAATALLDAVAGEPPQHIELARSAMVARASVAPPLPQTIPEGISSMRRAIAFAITASPLPR